MFTAANLALGMTAAFMVGVSKTGIPGGALLAVPMFAMIFEGRLIAGGTLPILIAGDLFAVAWYHSHARWDLLRPIAPWVGLGFVAGTAFFVAIGAASRSLEVTIGVIVLFIVGLQMIRLIRRTPPRPPNTATAATYGTAGGFTTFVANAAGPVINTYLIGLDLPKTELVGTQAWFYLVVNLAKIPLYLAIGALAAGGVFFTAESLLFDLVLIPAVVIGAFAGRAIFTRVPQRAFLIVVLVLSAAGGLDLLL